MSIDLSLLAPDAVTPALTAKLRSLACDLDLIAIAATAVAVTVGGPAHIMVPANDLTVHAQDDRAKGGCIGAASGNNRGLARHRAVHRRLALSAITGGQS